MKQTETYDLNLIEMSDTFNTAPLNENAQKLESAVVGEAAQRAQDDAALSRRVTVLEGRKIVAGSYSGTNNGSQTIQLGFDPIFVLVEPIHNIPYTVVKDRPTNNGLQLVSGGFKVSSSLNYYGGYNYLAIL